MYQPELSGTASNAWPLGTPWFLQIASSTACHITGTNSSGPVYSKNFSNPVVAFGSQAGGTQLYTGQSYSFGVVSGGQNLNPLVSGTTQDFKVDVYATSSFASGTAANVTPITTQAIHLPRPGETSWETFAQNGYQQTLNVTGTSGSNSLNCQVMIQYASSGFGQAGSFGNYPLLVTVNSNSAAFYLKISVKGAVQNGTRWDWMAVSNPNDPTTGDFSLSYTLDFTDRLPWQSAYLDRPSFAGTPLPTSYQGMSLDDLLSVTPAVSGTDSLLPITTTSGSATYMQTGTSAATVTSPELVSNPVLDNFVAAMGNDPMALANYVQNEIELTDALALPNGTTSGTLSITDQSINFGGVNRGALGVLLEGQGSPVEQCGLLVYLLRKAGVPCGYAFGPVDQMKMLDSQMSKMLRMQLSGAQDFGVTAPSSGPALISVNYPWVAAYINGQWVHIFPWIKDTVVEEGYDLYDYMPQGYKTGAEWVRKYLYDDPNIRTPGTESYDNPGVLFPAFIQKNLPSNLSIDDIGVTVYNRRHYYTNWSEFPRPWQRPAVSGTGNLYTDLMSYSKAAFGNTDKLFDTVTVKASSNNNLSKQIGPFTLYTALLHDRRFLLYHAPMGSGTATSGTWTNFAMILSLEPVSPIGTGTAAFTNSGGDTYLLNKQYTYVALDNSDDNLTLTLDYARHRTVTSGTGAPFLGIADGSPAQDVRPLRKGDTAAICLNFGRVTHWMLEVHEENYWKMQQQLLLDANALVDIELAQGLPAYLMGMSYYYREGGFINQYENLTKMQVVSSVAHGLSKLSPSRNTSGVPKLNNGALDLRYPNVDIRPAWVRMSRSLMVRKLSSLLIQSAMRMGTRRIAWPVAKTRYCSAKLLSAASSSSVR